MRRSHWDLQQSPWWVPRNRRRIDRQGVAFIDDAGVVAKGFRCAVVVKEAVMLPFHVVQFRKDIGGNLLVPPHFIGEELERPAYINVSIQGADSPVFAIDQRL